MEGIEKFVSSLMKRMCITWRRWKGSNPGVVRLAHRCCMMESFISRLVR